MLEKTGEQQLTGEPSKKAPMEVREGEDVSYLIIDEMSMVGRRSLGQIDHLLSKKGPIEVRCCDRREGEGCMYLAKYLTKNDALALTEEDGDDGLPPLLDDSDDDLSPSCSYLIIDEMSMVGRRSLGQIDHLLQQATGKCGQMLE